LVFDLQTGAHVREYDQLLSESAAKLRMLENLLISAEQAHRIMLRSGDVRPLDDLRELNRWLDAARETLQRRTDFR